MGASRRRRVDEGGYIVKANGGGRYRKEGRGRGITWRSGSALKKYWGVVEGVGEERRVVLLRSEANWGGVEGGHKQGCGASQSSQSVHVCSLVFFNPGRARVLDVAQH